MGSIVRDFKLPRSLVSGYLLFKREIMHAQRTSQGGWLWEFITPIAIAGIFMLMFNLRALDVSVSGMSYEAFVITGVLSWQIFALSFNRGINILVTNKVLTSHINVSPSVFVWFGLFQGGWVASTRASIIVAVFAAFWGLLWTGVFSTLGGAISLALLGYATGMILAPFRVLYGDVEHFSRIVLQVGFYASGTVFPVPDEILPFNPVALLINAERSGLTGLALGELAAPTMITVLFTLTLAIISGYIFTTGTRYLRHA